MAITKRIKLDINVLLEWTYDDNNIKNENYSVLSNLNLGTRDYVSFLPLNSEVHTLFCVDSVIKKYSQFNTESFNFLKKQNYAGNLITYDKIKLYFPINYVFNTYRGFYLNVYTLDYANENTHSLCRFFYDIALDDNIGMIDLETPFTYDEKLWGKSITLEIPSIYNIAKDRIINDFSNTVIPNTINYNISNGVGLSQSAPIFIDFSYIVTGDVVLDKLYYRLGDTFETSVPQQPEYQSLGVEIIESSQGDFFEIFGIYKGTNENMDDFVSDVEAKGKKIELEYVVTLFEENIQSGYPQTFVVSENFSQKLLYRPIIRYSNTTAAIDVQMNVIDLVNNSQIERYASIGLTKNIFKYGKTLSRINLDSSVFKPKIYKAKPETIIMNGTTNSDTSSITKVPYPVLYDKYKLLVNSTVSINSEYKSNGLLNIVITPFDNIVKFTLATAVDSQTGEPIPYDLFLISNNAKLKLVFKSDAKTLEIDYFAQSGDNDFKNGEVVFKIKESDIATIKSIYNKKFKNFYLILYANDSKTLLYSGKYDFYENIKFVDVKKITKSTVSSGGTGVGVDIYKKQLEATNKKYNQTVSLLNQKIKKLELDRKVTQNSQFNATNVPLTTANNQIKNNKNYFNLLIFIKKKIVKADFETYLKSLGIKTWIYNDYVYYITAVHVLKVNVIEKKTEYVSKVIRINIYDGQNQSAKTNNTITESQVTKAIAEKFNKLNSSQTSKNSASSIKYIADGIAKTIKLKDIL
jgi:hypothetical protein